jgi:ankyrin repeat protein
VEKGADVGQIVRGNATVLHICAEHGLKLAVAAIIKTENSKKCCEIQTEDGNLPVHLAGMAGHKDIVKILLPLSSQTVNSTVDQILEDGVHRMAAWTDRANAHNAELKVP